MARLFQQLRFGNLFRRFKQKDQSHSDWQIPPFVVASANWPQIIEKNSDFNSEGRIPNPGSSRLLAKRDTEKGIFDVYGQISFNDISVANIELRLSIARVDIAAILQHRTFVTRSKDPGFINVWNIGPFTFETDGDTTFQLFHLSGLSTLANVAGWLVVSQRN